MNNVATRRPFTGWHMALILIAFFAVVIGVNLFMARNAIGTFGGVVVDNSYVASQNFNRWLDAEKVQGQLGWTVAASRRDDGRIAVQADGPRAAATLAGEARHPLGREPDQALQFTHTGGGLYVSRDPLPAGRWTLRLTLAEGETTWRGEIPLQ